MVKYKGIILHKNSESYRIYSSNDPDKLKKLDKHLKELEKNYQELLKRYASVA